MSPLGLFPLLALAVVPRAAPLDSLGMRALSALEVEPGAALDLEDLRRLDAVDLEDLRRLDDGLVDPRLLDPVPRDGAITVGLALTILSADRTSGRHTELVLRAVVAVDLAAWLEPRPTPALLGPPGMERERGRRCGRLASAARAPDAGDAGPPIDVELRRAREAARWQALRCEAVRP